MRISDWNSDVCSSDLASRGSPRLPHLGYAPTMIPMLLTLLALAAQPAAAEQPATPAAPDLRPYVALVTDLGTLTVRIEDRRAPVPEQNFHRSVARQRLRGFQFYRPTREGKEFVAEK